MSCSSKNAHILVGANTMAQAQAQSSAAAAPEASQQPPRSRGQSQGPRGQGQQQAPRARSGGRQPAVPAMPAFNRDHPLYQVINQQQSQQNNINQILANNAQNINNMSGNGREQGQGATPAQTQRPQVSQASQGASAAGPFNFEAPRIPATPAQSRPRSFSEAVSGNLAARQTVRQSIVQQASTRAQITAMSDEEWRRAMERAFGGNSASPTQEGSRSRTQSLNDTKSNQGL